MYYLTPNKINKEGWWGGGGGGGMGGVREEVSWVMGIQNSREGGGGGHKKSPVQNL